MTSEMTWRDAIIKVLKDAGEPLHYQRITSLIGERGLRPVTGATPANTVAANLNTIVNDETNQYYKNIQKTSRGVFAFVDSSDTPMDVREEDVDPIDQEELNGDVSVHAFGLYWDREKVNWGKGTKILGRQARGADPVDFSDQQGVYILYKDRSIVYVGRTEGSLRARLKYHVTNSLRAFRWDRFSWFGFRPVEETGELGELLSDVKTENIIAVLESILIETLEPPVNGKRGDYMGELYEQTTDPEIASQQARNFLLDLAGT